MIKIIVAADNRNAIGKEGKLPWHLGEDMKRFRELTVNKYVFMGRKTYESIDKPLRDRFNFVVSSSPDFNPKGAFVMHSMDDVMKFYLDNVGKDIFIIGGASLYRYFWYVADEIYFTRVNTEIEDADTFVPYVDETLYEEISRDSKENDDKNDFSCDFIHYVRKSYM